MLPKETLANGAPRQCPYCRKKPKLDVYSSTAGFYVGTYCDCGPYSRESEYYRKAEEAREALKSGSYGR